MEEHTADDQSHYEISLTAGQAFAAFVLLLLSLAATFAFGLMLGKGQADERLVVQKETPVVSEASVAQKKNGGEIVELGVPNDDFDENATPKTESTTSDAPAVADEATTSSAPAPAIVEPATKAADAAPAATPAPVAAPVAASPKVAQLLSTSDQKTAEAMAVKLIDQGFNTAYVERGSSDKGTVFRVRVKFDSEQDARAAEPKRREFSKDVWNTSR
jgi:cytoskeletal protein RodZ